MGKIAMQHQGGRERQHGQRDLRESNERTAGIAPGDARRVTGRGRRRDQVNRKVVRTGKSDDGQRSEEAGEQSGAPSVDPFPPQDRVHIVKPRVAISPRGRDAPRPDEADRKRAHGEPEILSTI